VTTGLSVAIVVLLGILVVIAWITSVAVQDALRVIERAGALADSVRLERAARQREEAAARRLREGTTGL